MLQAQYVFVYDALLEANMSGRTNVSCTVMKTTFEQLNQLEQGKEKTPMQEQFEVGTICWLPRSTSTVPFISLNCN